MPRIRDDLVGAIHVAGAVLFAGDEVPDGVPISEAHLAPEKPKRGRPKKDTEASHDK